MQDLKRKYVIFFICVYNSLISKTLVKSTQNLTLEKPDKQ